MNTERGGCTHQLPEEVTKLDVGLNCAWWCCHRSGLRFRRATIHTVPGESSGEGDGGTGGAGRHGGNVHTDGVQLLKRSGQDVQVEMA